MGSRPIVVQSMIDAMSQVRMDCGGCVQHGRRATRGVAWFVGATGLAGLMLAGCQRPVTEFSHPSAGADVEAAHAVAPRQDGGEGLDADGFEEDERAFQTLDREADPPLEAEDLVVPGPAPSDLAAPEGAAPAPVAPDLAAVDKVAGTPTQVIRFDETDPNPGPTDRVAAQPERAPSGSLLTPDVLSGPR